MVFSVPEFTLIRLGSSGFEPFECQQKSRGLFTEFGELGKLRGLTAGFEELDARFERLEVGFEMLSSRVEAMLDLFEKPDAGFGISNGQTRLFLAICLGCASSPTHPTCSLPPADNTYLQVLIWLFVGKPNSPSKALASTLASATPPAATKTTIASPPFTRAPVRSPRFPRTGPV